jgi:glycosyltransferase involved in cell wall biosynthesis
MAQIGDILEENVKKSLNYKYKSVSPQRKLFNKLKILCLANGIETRCKGFFIEGVKIHLFESDKYVGAYWAKPIVRHGRLYLSFKKPKRQLIDASHVDVFGEAIQHP